MRKTFDAELQELNYEMINMSAAAEEYGKTPEDYVLGANVAAFIKVADAMLAEGIAY